MDNISKEEIHKREERCTFCDHLDHVDGFCMKFGKDCWLIENCDDYCSEGYFEYIDRMAKGEE